VATVIASVDRFAVFEDTCRAAGIESGTERLKVFLALPEPIQDGAFSDLAKRLKRASVRQRSIVPTS
jgi:hypothetical protein